MSKHYNGIFVFNSKEEAERFIKLYCAECVSPNNTDDDTFFTEWLRSYYGKKIYHKYCVSRRFCKEDIDNMKKYIGLKEKKFNGRKVYVYE